jgi:hypothetical protein
MKNSAKNIIMNFQSDIFRNVHVLAPFFARPLDLREFQPNCNSYLWTYDLFGPVCNAFDEVKSITRASGRGLGPVENNTFLGHVKWH